MKTFCIHLAFSALVLCSIFQGTEAENSTTQTHDRHEERKLTPLQLGMQPFFKMTNNFLELIVPDYKAETAFYNITRYFFEPYIKAHLEDDGDTQRSAEAYSKFITYMDNNWEQVCKDYVGFLVCVIIGVLFIIIMPIWGLCFCCCRCCCRRKVIKHGRRHDGCKRACYGSVMVVINTLMLTGLICAFIHNELLRQQLMENDPDVESKPLLTVLKDSFDEIEKYKTSAIHDFSTLVNQSTQEVDDLVLSLNDIPIKAQEKLSKVTNADSILATATSLATRVESMDRELKVIQDKTDSLKRSQDRLVGDLNNRKSDILTTCNGRCSSSITDSISNMDIQADFKKMDQIQIQKGRIQQIVAYNLTSLVLQSKAEYDKVISMVDTKTRDEVATVTEEANQLLSEVRQSANAIMYELERLLDFDSTEKVIWSDRNKEFYENAGNYSWYVGIALCCVVLLIILFIYLGLCFGFCGDQPDEKGGACNRGVGANLLLAGVGFTFLFCWLLMLVTTVTFVVGGIVHTETCTDYSKFEDQSLIKAMDSQFLVDRNGNIGSSISKCRENEALFQALGWALGESFNISELFDLNNFEVKDKLRAISEVTIDINSIKILSSDMETHLQDLQNAGLDTIDFNTIIAELNKEVLAFDMNAVASALQQEATRLRNNGFSTAASELEQHVRSLYDVYNYTVVPMHTDMKKVKDAVINLQTLVTGKAQAVPFSMELQNFLDEFKEAERKINAEGKQALKDFLLETANEKFAALEKILADTKAELTGRLAKCRPLYDVLENGVYSVCVTLLGPFNGFWFSLGWCLFFFIPSIIFCVLLADLYRKPDVYEDADNKSFDDPHFEPFSGVYPGDNIPLEDISRRKARGNTHGHGNDAYDRDNTGSRDFYYRNGGPPYGDDGGYDWGRGYGGGYQPQRSPSPPNPPHYHNNAGRNRFY